MSSTDADADGEVTAADPEVQEVFDRFDGMATKETAIEIVRQLRNPDDVWGEVQRSTPAEYVIGVPDKAAVWYCLEHHTHTATITVYWAPDNDEAYVSVSGDNISMAVEDFRDVGRAVAYADGVAAALDVPT